MAGRIRTIKPEWLEDELLAREPDHVRLLSIAVILIADDHGRGRAKPAFVASQAYTYSIESDDPREIQESLRKVRDGLTRLSQIRFLTLYEVDGQTYFEIRNWSKHQKVQHVGKERVPAPKLNENGDVEGLIESLRKIPEVLVRTDDDPPSTLTPDLRPHTSDLIPETSDVAGAGVCACAPASQDPIQDDDDPDELAPPSPKKKPEPDVGELELTPDERAVAQAIASDPTLAPIVKRPNRLARDLVPLGPGIDLVRTIHAAGAWIRADPTRRKSNGNKFLNGWVKREQDLRGGRAPEVQRTLGYQPIEERKRAELNAEIEAKRAAAKALGDDDVPF